jgi:hypothetical protein
MTKGCDVCGLSRVNGQHYTTRSHLQAVARLQSFMAEEPHAEQDERGGIQVHAVPAALPAPNGAAHNVWASNEEDGENDEESGSSDEESDDGLLGAALADFVPHVDQLPDAAPAGVIDPLHPLRVHGERGECDATSVHTQPLLPDRTRRACIYVHSRTHARGMINLHHCAGDEPAGPFQHPAGATIASQGTRVSDLPYEQQRLFSPFFTVFEAFVAAAFSHAELVGAENTISSALSRPRARVHHSVLFAILLTLHTFMLHSTSGNARLCIAPCSWESAATSCPRASPTFGNASTSVASSLSSACPSLVCHTFSIPSPPG